MAGTAQGLFVEMFSTRLFFPLQHAFTKGHTEPTFVATISPGNTWTQAKSSFTQVSSQSTAHDTTQRTKRKRSHKCDVCHHVTWAQAGERKPEVLCFCFVLFCQSIQLQNKSLIPRLHLIVSLWKRRWMIAWLSNGERKFCYEHFYCRRGGRTCVEKSDSCSEEIRSLPDKK